MLLGIYFGTTQIVVVSASYPGQPYLPVNFHTPSGEWLPNYPISIVAQGNKRLYGLDAYAKQHKPGWSMLRTWQNSTSTDTEWNISLGKRSIPALELLIPYFTQLRTDLITRSNLQGVTVDEPLETWVAVAAEANDPQRLLIPDALRAAGFVIAGLIQDPIDPDQAATALDLTLAAQTQPTPTNNAHQQRGTHLFGVWREAEDGRTPAFDPIFQPSPSLSASDEYWPWVAQRCYHPAHNIGHFHYLQCSHLTETGEPAGDIIEWNTLVIAFDEQLSGLPGLETKAVERLPHLREDWIEERYECSANGALSVSFYNHTTGFHQRYILAPV